MKKATDFLIECQNPEAFDKTIQSLGSAVLATANKDTYLKKDGYYVMRVLVIMGF